MSGLFRSFILTAGFALVSGALTLPAQAASYYAKLKTQVSSSSSGYGTVLAGTSSTASGTYGSSSTSSSKSTTTRSGNITFYAFAKVKDGYEFSHWSTSDGGTSSSTANPYAVSIAAASSSGSSNAKTTTIYANFKKKPYYAQLVANVSSSSSGRGSVYAGTTTAEGAYSGSSSSSAVLSTQTSGGPVSFYAFARANDGYAFSHWSSSDGGTALASSTGVSPYEVLVPTTATSESAPAIKSVYAVFGKKATCYAQVVTKVDAGSEGFGAVAVGTSSTAPGAYSATSATSAVQTTMMQDGLSTFYAFAQPNAGCEFLYWTTESGGASVSKEAAHQLTVVTSSEDKANPTRVTYYAVFRKIPQEPVYGTHDLSGRAIKEGGSIKVLSNTTVSEAAKAFDGNASTYFSPPTSANELGVSWTGISFTTNVIVTRIDFSGNYARRMIGGAFQGANRADFGDAENILVVEQYRSGMSTNVLEDVKGPYRYLRFIGMYGGNVSEIKFYGLTAADGEMLTAPVVTASGADDRVAYVSVCGGGVAPQVYRIQRAMADFCEEDDYETCVTLAPELGEVATWRDTRRTDFTKYRIQSVNANGVSDWKYFEIEPEKLIAGGPVKPTFSGDLPGFYASSATVTIEYPVDGAEIYYTTDGSTPTKSSKKYSGPITLKDVCSTANNLCNIPANPTEITDNAYKWNKPSVDQPNVNVIRARAFLADGSASPMDVAGTWLVGPTVNEHKLRVVSLQTDYDGLFSDETGILVPGNIYKTQGFKTDNGYGQHTVGRPNANYFQEGINWERPTQVQIFDTNRTELLNIKMGIRVRGCWSRAAAKKSMTCFARKDYGTKNIKAQLFNDEGKKKFKRFLLRNGGNDWYQLALRDAVAQSMFRGFVKTDTQGYEPCVLYLNGEYWGVFNMRHGYCKQHFEEWNGSDGDVDYSKLDHESGNHFEVEEGDLVSLWNTHYQMAKMVPTSTSTLSDADFAEVEKMVDIDDLIDNAIVHTFLANRDWICGGNNGGYWRNRTGADQRWHFVVFDTDIGMAFWGDDSGTDYIKKNLEANVTDDTETKMVPNFFSVCFKSAIFKRRFANRYADLLNTALATTRTSAIIEREVARVEHERTRNQNRWTNMQSNYSSNLSNFKTFFKNRPAKEFGFVKTHCCGSSASLVNLTVEATEGVGTVQLNSLVSGTHMALPFTGQYFSDIPVTLTAVPARGYKFAGWKNGTSIVSTEATYSPTITAATTLTATFEQLAPGEDIIQGEYPNGQTVALAEPAVLKIGDATFGGPLKITGADVTLALQAGATAVIPQIDATGSRVTIDGAGALEMSGSERLISCAGLVVSNGTLRLELADATLKTNAVELSGSYLQYGGDVTMNLKSANQVYGFYSDTKGVLAEIHGGTFTTTIDGGDKSATFKMNKGSNDVLLKGGVITVNLSGTGPRFVDTEGKLDIAGSKIKVKTLNAADGETPAGAGARVFKSVKTMEISDGLVDGKALGEGSEMFSSDKKIVVSGGVVSVEAADDCFSAAENITVSSGKVHALSHEGDALDSNGNMLISGGYVFAFATGAGGEGLDVDPKDGESDGLDHTLIISGGTVVAVGYDKILHAPDAGSGSCYKTSSMSSGKKYVEVAGLHPDGSKTITTVNWDGRHADGFSLIATCPDFVGTVTETKDKPNKDLPYVKKLDDDIDGVFLTTLSVMPIVAEGEDEPGSGSVPVGQVSRFDGIATYDGLVHTLNTNALVDAVSSPRQGIEGFAIEYAAGDSASAPTSGWSSSAPDFSQAGEYVIWYKVSAPGYADFLHAAKVTINPCPGVVVTVIGNCVTNVYDGKSHTAKGYEIGDDSPLYDTAFVKFSGSGEVTKTAAGTYAMGLKESDFANTNGNFIGVTFKVTDGELVIRARQCDLSRLAWDYTGAFTYDGNSHGVALTGVPSGVAVAYGNVTNVNAGAYEATARLTASVKNYEPLDFTTNLTWRIVPREGVVVTVSGECATYSYNGKTRTSSGYTIATEDKFYDIGMVTFSGTASVSGVEVGTYMMGLESDQFGNSDPNFANVEFVISDGCLTVKKATNRWLEDPWIRGKTGDGKPAELYEGDPKYGTVIVTYDDGTEVAPVSAGSHTAIFTVPAAQNYDVLEMRINYEITAAAASGGKSYDTVEDAVAAANSESPVTFAQAPTINEKTHSIVTADGQSVVVPDYYDMKLSGNTVEFSLNSSAMPEIASGTPEAGGEAIPAIDPAVGGDGAEVGVGTMTKEGLFYALESGVDPKDLAVPASAKWVPGNGGVIQLRADKPANSSGRAFYRITVTDVEH